MLEIDYLISKIKLVPDKSIMRRFQDVSKLFDETKNL